MVPNKFENLDLEQVSYQGAYIRTMTLIIAEGIIKNHLMAVQAGYQSPQIDLTSNALETIFRELIEGVLSDFHLKRND